MKAPQAGARTKKPKQPFPVQQPMQPMGGFATVKRTAYLRGMARDAGLMKGEPKIATKLKKTNKIGGKGRKAKGLGAFSQQATPGMSGSANMVRGGGLTAR